MKANHHKNSGNDLRHQVLRPVDPSNTQSQALLHVNALFPLSKSSKRLNDLQEYGHQRKRLRAMLPGITQTQIDNVKAFIKKSELNEEPTRNV